MKIITRILTSIVSASSHIKCVSLSNQKCELSYKTMIDAKSLHVRFGE